MIAGNNPVQNGAVSGGINGEVSQITHNNRQNNLKRSYVLRAKWENIYKFVMIVPAGTPGTTGEEEKKSVDFFERMTTLPLSTWT